MADPKGTCHLVGCVGKGVHAQGTPHAKPTDPPLTSVMSAYQAYIEHLEAEIAAVERLRLMAPTEIAGKTYPKVSIGVPDSWAPYEGGPTIPKPTEHCLGFARLQVYENSAIASCSIHPGSWSERIDRGCAYDMGALVDHHKAYCTNRKPR